MLLGWFSSFKAKLYLAFSVIAGLTLFATVFALYLFREYAQVVGTTANHAIPQMQNVLQLSERAVLLAALAPVLAASEKEANLQETEIRLDALADEIDRRARQLESPAYGTAYQGIKKDSIALVATHAALKDATLARLSLRASKFAMLAEIRAVQGELLDTLSPIVYGTTSLTNLFARRSGRQNARAVIQLGELDTQALFILLDMQVAAGRIIGLLQGGQGEINNPHREQDQKLCETAFTNLQIQLRSLEALLNTPALQPLAELIASLADSHLCAAITGSERAPATVRIQDLPTLLDSAVASQKAQVRSAFQETAQRVKTTPVAIAEYAVREFQHALDIKAEGNLLIALLTAAVNADNKHTVSNLRNRYTQSLSVFRKAIKVFSNGALAERNPVLAASLLGIQNRLITLGQGGNSSFKLRLFELNTNERIQSLLTNHRTQATQLTDHAEELVGVVRQEVDKLQRAMKRSQITGVSILVLVCLGSVLIAGLIVHFTAQILSRRESDLRAAKNAAEAANKELEAFNYSVSHDLRAPLRTLNGFSEALLEDYSNQLDETGKRYLQFLRDGSREMSELIDGFLQLSRCTRGALMQERVNLSALAEEVVKSYQETEPERQVSVSIAPSIEGTGDPRLLKTALENLIGNAWKYTSKTPNPFIEIGSEQETGQSIYYVRDNGAGFDMAFADKLFLPFQRLHKTSEFEGSGIGLATVQRIIHRHGGRVWAESAVGKGAIFKFTLAAGEGGKKE